MEITPESAVIEMKKLERAFTYDGTEVLTAEIEYPKVSVPGRRQSEARINAVIQSQVSEYLREAAGPMYRNAVEDYNTAQQQGYPFRQHNLTAVYTITLNENCTLSFYRDKYTYTGGAHGLTLRQSDSFDLCTGRMITLPSLFQHGEHWYSKVLAEILRQADEEMQGENAPYFENYRELILQNFDQRSFFLTDTGISVYYQQYDIGPYAIGLPVFEIPFESVGATPPHCDC